MNMKTEAIKIENWKPEIPNVHLEIKNNLEKTGTVIEKSLNCELKEEFCGLKKQVIQKLEKDRLDIEVSKIETQSQHEDISLTFSNHSIKK